MKQTEYLIDVLQYYHENDIVLNDPNEGRWEDAHTPYPRGMANDTVPLLHEHHVIHDLWQSIELNRCCFFPGHAKKVLLSANFWPTGWFDLYEGFEHYSFVSQSNAGKIGGRKSQATIREKQLGVFAPGVQLKAAKRGGQVSNSLRYECLVTGFQSTGPSLSKYQNARGIDTKLRKQI